MTDVPAGFEADPERLATQAGQFDDLAGRAETIHRTLAEALSTTGECWGTDAVGQSFRTAHAGPADGTLARLSSLTSDLGGVGARFAGTAATYTATDDGAVERLRAVDPDA
ncbi:hypothetical protein [Actinophytocola gossypii]|uniref:WXG100 family type VII secretion target n=1 Tax=Actinophytocola gossypii TaxID=2812003 RepID=A0ABT2JEA2_9PSEU|nr:hypothetical protein [Actinophytocola gossypii]MCT2586200.1 hypothetical protein [Actinophytocola gossypii]